MNERRPTGFCALAVVAARVVLVAMVLMATLARPSQLRAADPIVLETTINTRLRFDLGEHLKQGETFVGIDPAGRSLISVSAEGAGSYLPAANFTGEEQTRAWIKGAEGPAVPLAITLRVSGEATGVEARGDSLVTDEDVPVVVYPLANDAAGPGSGQLTISLETPPDHGVAEIGGDGSLLYTPDLQWHGEDSLTYRASDGVSTMVARVDIAVTSVRDLPTANPDAVVIPQDELATIDVLVNDFDGDGDVFWFNGVDAPLYGSAEWSDRDRMIRYQPLPGFYGIDQFTYRIADTDGISYGTVTVTVDGAPTANDDAIAVVRGTSVTFDPTTNDTDPEGSSLSVSAVSAPVAGRASISPDGTVSYTASDPSAVSDSFTYSVSDLLGNAATATIMIQIGDTVAAPPSAEDDEFLVNEDSAGNTLDLLGNDTDPSGAGLALIIESSPEHGDLVVDTLQTVTYLPDAEFSGTDSFSYAVSSPAGRDEAVVTITVQAQNDLPTAVADYAETGEDTPVTIDVLANDTDLDGDALVVSSVTDGLLGTAEVDTDGRVTFTPNANAAGMDQFSYVVTDGQGGTAMMAVDVAILPVPDPPTVTDDAFAVEPGAARDLDVLANDGDPDGDPLVGLVVQTPPRHGEVSVTVTGQVHYVPAKDYEGPDSFTYAVSDPAGQQTEATVRLTIGDPNQQPEAAPDEDLVRAGKAVRVDVLANDTDPDGDELTIVRVSTPSHGTAEIRSGTIVYKPDAGFVGTDEFTYRISDGTDTDTGRVSITVSDPHGDTTDASAAVTAVTAAFGTLEETAIVGGRVSATFVATRFD